MISPERIRNGQFNKVIEYIDKGNNSYNLLSYDSVSPIPQQPRINEINHRIFIFASKEKKLVFGILELFGHLTFSGVLTDSWNGENINKVYVIDPITGNNKNE